MPSRLIHAFQDFFRLQAAGGILLVFTAGLAIVWANSPWQVSYHALWHTPVTVGVGALAISMDLHHWINDALMAVFFFLVGLEIKREVLVGELASPRRAALPAAAALGGMVIPALLYIAFNSSGEGARGWGVPMATDIAFALGTLALLGNRVPVSVKVFLTALAIVDDLGAVLVIAVFYSSGVAWSWLGWAGVVLLLMWGANKTGFRRPGVYLLLGIIVWFAFLQSGVHATVAGVLTALTIPAGGRIDTEKFRTQARALVDEFPAGGGAMLTHDQADSLYALSDLTSKAAAPLQRIEHDLHPWVSFAIMPIFALANAGVTLEGSVGEAIAHPVTAGIAVGLVLGKLAGITGFAWLAVKLGLAEVPSDMTNRHLVGAAALGGIGFTMSLFIAQLAFGNPELLVNAKVGILGGSVIAGAVGWVILARSPRTAT
ncbi:MAG: Na+/H+ antiporter NhaA [Gemmatimonadales bacterium]